MIIIQDLDYNNVNDLENQYREYLKNHIQNVNRSWNEFLKPSLLKNLEDFDLIEDDLSDIDELVLSHDASAPQYFAFVSGLMHEPLQTTSPDRQVFEHTP